LLLSLPLERQDYASLLAGDLLFGHLFLPLLVALLD
jgi:hypothetical protein